MKIWFRNKFTNLINPLYRFKNGELNLKISFQLQILFSFELCHRYHKDTKKHEMKQIEHELENYDRNAKSNTYADESTAS